jgi:hypothetical protein
MFIMMMLIMIKTYKVSKFHISLKRWAILVESLRKMHNKPLSHASQQLMSLAVG